MGAIILKFKLSRYFSTAHLPQSFAILCLIVQELSCRQTNTCTNKAILSIQPPRSTMLRRWHSVHWLGLNVIIQGVPLKNNLFGKIHYRSYCNRFDVKIIANTPYKNANGLSCGGCYGGTLPKTHAKAGQHHAELKDCLSTIQNDLLQEFIDKAIVSFCNRLWSCVTATGEHWHCEYCLNTEWAIGLGIWHAFMTETFELLMKSCAKLHSLGLFVNIQCTTALCSLQKVNFEV